jgi:hypothetical protein
MKMQRFYHMMFLFLAMFVTVHLCGQNSPFDPGKAKEASRIREHVELLADRSLYLVNEDIQFLARLSVQGLPEAWSWSSVLYVELVSADGRSRVKAKFMVIDQSCSGKITIPETLTTGNYFLRSYTRWMRNAGAAVFSYTPLKIINPFRSEVAGEETEQADKPEPSYMAYETGSLELAVHSGNYKRGEEVTLQLSGTTAGPEAVYCCLTAVPSGAINMEHLHMKHEGGPEDEHEFEVEFLPDLYDPSISGTVLSSQSNLPLPGTKLHFTLLGAKPGYFVAVSDDQGRFVASVPARTGLNELFVTPQLAQNQDAEVRIDQDFSTETLPFSVEPFLLSVRESEVATQMSRMMQLSEAFNMHAAKDAVSSVADPVPFYGSADHSIVMDDYIELPTLEEVFINLVMTVSVHEKRDGYVLNIESDNPALSLYEPMAMIDQVPVFDLEKLMAISPRKLSRIDIVEDVFIKGNMKYGGLVNLVSREADMGGIDLPKGAYFFDFQSLEAVDTLKAGAIHESDRLPDMRNTLLWMNDLVVEKGVSREITFQAPDFPGEYVVLVRGVDSEGNVHSAKARFTVTDSRQ